MGVPDFERKQRVRIRTRSHSREIAGEITAVTEDSLWIMLAESPVWLEKRHLADGIDLSFWRTGNRFVAENVRLLSSDLDRGRIHLEAPTSFDIIQRRKTFRENVQVKVRWAFANLPEETLDLAPHEAVTEDLGGGGLCLHTPASPVSINDELQLEIELPDRKVRARGRIKWAGQDRFGQRKMGLAFTRIGQREQDLVYGFLFDLQRSRLRAS